MLHSSNTGEAHLAQILFQSGAWISSLTWTGFSSFFSWLKHTHIYSTNSHKLCWSEEMCILLLLVSHFYICFTSLAPYFLSQQTCENTHILSSKKKKTFLCYCLAVLSLKEIFHICTKWHYSFNHLPSVILNSYLFQDFEESLVKLMVELHSSSLSVTAACWMRRQRPQVKSWQTLSKMKSSVPLPSILFYKYYWREISHPSSYTLHKGPTFTFMLELSEGLV